MEPPLVDVRLLQCYMLSTFLTYFPAKNIGMNKTHFIFKHFLIIHINYLSCNSLEYCLDMITTTMLFKTVFSDYLNECFKKN